MRLINRLYRHVFFAIGICLFAGRVSGQINIEEANALIERLLPGRSSCFHISYKPSAGFDVFELSGSKNNISIEGNSINAVAAGINHYLKYYCNTYVSWYASDPIEVPAILPPVIGTVRKVARAPQRFFLNYCTFGYTMPWWQWQDWERCIDWMALNGINLPLAITGQEAVWYRVWKKFGLTDQEIRGYFTGPAHLPWHRMSNLDKWHSPLPLSWINDQELLQKKIVARERALGMKPVLPAFAGHVPEALKKRFPDSKISQLSSWGGFEDKYRSFFLDPFDTLFSKIQSAFLHEQTKLFGSDHIYGADPFNEVKPPSWEQEYLAKVSRTIYESISAADDKATWLMMTWIYYFEREHWTDPRIESFVKAVPANKLMLLDYFCENTEVWKMTNAYYGKPFIWCYLGNFGGNTMLAGNIREVETRMEYVFANAGANLWGIGSTLEGFDVNPVMYDYVFEKVWSDGQTNTADWIRNWADRRAGSADNDIRAAWEILLNKVYTTPAALGQATLTNARPTLTGHGNWTTDSKINYNNDDLVSAWRLMLQSNTNRSAAYRYDIVNVGRQALGNYFTELRDSFTVAYQQKNIILLEKRGKQMIDLLTDLESLLATQSSFLLGKWINDAKRKGAPGEQSYYEQNARNIITTWGDRAQSLNDYGNRSWAGLTETYYKPRWQMFINTVVTSVKQNRPFDEQAFLQKVCDFEQHWVMQTGQAFSEKPRGDSYGICKKILKKYFSKTPRQ